MSHKSNSHFLILRRHKEPMKSPCLQSSTYNKLVANQYQSWKTTFISIPWMKKSEIKLHLFNFVFKLVAMSIKDSLSALKHIKAPKILSWRIPKSGICIEFFKLGTWWKYFVFYSIIIEKVKCYLYLVTKKMDNEINF